MKNINKVFLAVILIITFKVAGSYAQTCGLAAKIVNVQGGILTPHYYADTSLILPGWDVYSIQWEVNNVIISNNTSFDSLLPAGFSLVCLSVSTTNGVDSCTDTKCNTFHSTGDAVFPEFDVTTNGNTINVSGYYFGHPTYVPNSISYDFGDGQVSSSNQIIESHTYTSAGDYLVCLYVTLNTPGGFSIVQGGTCRKVHVGNGIPNINLGILNGNALCDSVSFYISCNPSFENAYAYGSYNQSFTQVNNQAYNYFQTGSIIGQEMIEVQVYDSVTTGYHNDVRHIPVFPPVCNHVPDTITGSIFEDLDFDGLRDANELGLVNLPIRVQSINTGITSIVASYYGLTDSTGDFSLLTPEVFTNITPDLNQSIYRLTFPEAWNINVNLNPSQVDTGYVFGVSQLSTSICGRTYLDDNNNGTYNQGADRNFSHVTIQAHNTLTGIDYYRISDNQGQYCFDLPPGNFVLKTTYFLLDSAIIAPDSIVINSAGGSFSNQNFGFKSIVPGNLSVEFVNLDNPRPGFGTSLRLKVYNSGFLPAKGTIVLNYDPAVTSISAFPASGIINTTNHTVTWVTDSLQPGVIVYYDIAGTLPASVPLGSILSNTSVITANAGFFENDLTNNTDILNLTVIGSFDPNDKLVTPVGYGTSGDVHHDTRLSYHINFQNTGTASAINIIVQDTLDDDLDMSTFLMEKASHIYSLVTNGRVVTWKFLNINLPDSNTNEPLSHGYIEYSIKPKQGLNDGTSINNFAAIYFDFNEPVITNTVVNTLQTNITGITNLNTNQPAWITPVPATNEVFIHHNEQQGNLSVTMFDVAGHFIARVYEGNALGTSVIKYNIQQLSAGMYFIKIAGEGGTQTIKMVKQ